MSGHDAGGHRRGRGRRGRGGRAARGSPAVRLRRAGAAARALEPAPARRRRRGGGSRVRGPARALRRPRRGPWPTSAGGWQFRTAPDLAAQAPPRRSRRRAACRAPRWRRWRVVAYHQPVTRARDRGDPRRVALSQHHASTRCSRAGLVAPHADAREAPGRPTHLGHHPGVPGAVRAERDLRDLPRRDDLLVEPPSVLQAPATQPSRGQPQPSRGQPQASREQPKPAPRERPAPPGGRTRGS